MQSKSLPPDSTAKLQALLTDAKTTYARLLTLIEHVLQSDLEQTLTRQQAFQSQIEQLMDETNIQLQLILEIITPWPDRRRDYPSELALDVDRFLDLLEKGLQGLGFQIQNRVQEVGEQHEALRVVLDRMNNQRRGIKGYIGSNSPDPRFFTKQA